MIIGWIYKIYYENKEEDESINIVYIGSTTQNNINDRFIGHRCDYKRWLDGKVEPVSIYPYFKEYDINNFKFEALECCEIEDIQQLRKIEQDWISNTNCVNSINAFITEEERKEYQKNYHIENKDKRREYVFLNRDKITNYNKEYRIKNIDRIKEREKKHKQKNRDEILKKKKERYNQNRVKILKELKNRNREEVNRKQREYRQRKNQNKI